MIWNKEPEAKHGDTRTILKFAYLPITNYGKTTTAWLEYVKLTQTYRHWDNGDRYWRTDKIEAI